MEGLRDKQLFFSYQNARCKDKDQQLFKSLVSDESKTPAYES
jgi:hypothetical protein